MLKLAALITVTLLATACTLHPSTDKHVLCEQAQRQNTYNQTLVNAPSAAATAELQKTIATNC